MGYIQIIRNIRAVLAQATVVSGFLQQPPCRFPVFHPTLIKCIMHIVQTESSSPKMQNPLPCNKLCRLPLKVILLRVLQGLIGSGPLSQYSLSPACLNSSLLRPHWTLVLETALILAFPCSFFTFSLLPSLLFILLLQHLVTSCLYLRAGLYVYLLDSTLVQHLPVFSHDI